MKSLASMSPEQREAIIADFKKRREERDAKYRSDCERIINDPTPVEKYEMVYPTYPDTKITVFNGAKKQIGAFEATVSLRKMFSGKKKIKVKAKIIDGQLEIMKVVA